MRLSRAHIEITNFCGLSCSFCEPVKNNKSIMDLTLFEKIHDELKGSVKEISYHILGDPLTVKNLDKYLDVSSRHGFSVSLTTSGFYLDAQPISTLFHPSVKQINISLSSFFANRTSKHFEEYMNKICEFAKKSSETPKRFVNLRLWNYGDDKYDKFNSDVLSYLSSFFAVDIKQDVDKTKLSSYVILVKDFMFTWPSIDKIPIYKHGTCYAIESQIGFLCNGDIVPCCLDANGAMKLGNIQNTSLLDAVKSERATSMVNGFKKNMLIEQMCQTCGFRNLKL